jgi:hypothetical protein
MEGTHFLNVDLDIYSKSDLKPLADAFGKKVFVLYAGPSRRKYKAVLELAAHTKSADATIRAFCKLIRALPRSSSRMWRDADQRDFSIGIQVMYEPNVTDFALSVATVKEAAGVGARIVFTVYSPKMMEESPCINPVVIEKKNEVRVRST